MADSEINSEVEDVLAEGALVEDVPLAPRREWRPLRRPIHWVLFIFSLSVGFGPAMAGLFFGATTIVGALQPNNYIPWWGGVLGGIMLGTCLTVLLGIIYGLVEADRAILLLTSLLAVVAWLIIPTLVYVLTYVVPNNPTNDMDCSSLFKASQAPCHPAG